ncbi:hypothetical protein P5V15_004568 [Pogonomyrmex californicus]
MVIEKIQNGLVRFDKSNSFVRLHIHMRKIGASIMRQKHRQKISQNKIGNDVAGRYSQSRSRSWLKRITAMYSRLRYKIINIVYLRICGDRRREGEIGLRKECDVSRDSTRLRKSHIRATRDGVKDGVTE